MLPDDDKDFEDMASSADPALDAQDAQPPAQAEAGAPDDANSSTAAQGEDDAGLLSVVRDVVAEREQPADQSAPPAEGEEDHGQDAQPPKDPDNDDYSDVPFHKHPRFQQLLRKAKAHEQDAVRYRNVQNFMDAHGLTAEEAANGLTTFALAKVNPVEAWKQVKPWVQKLLIAAGEVLPPDLQERVQKGEMSSEAALDLNRARAAQQSMQATQSFQEQRRQHEQQQSTAFAVTQAAEDWEADRRKKDPNFEAKLPSLMEKVAYLQRTEGVPNTPDGVKAQLQKAYKALVPPPAPAAPRAQQKRPITPIRGGQVAGGAKPVVNSTMDVLNNVMAKRQRA